MLAPFTRELMTGTGLVIGAGAAEIVSVTAMFWEAPVAPVLVAISITPEYVPASNPAGFTATTKLAGAEPAGGFTESQPALEAVAVKDRPAPPETVSKRV